MVNLRQKRLIMNNELDSYSLMNVTKEVGHLTWHRPDQTLDY